MYSIYARTSMKKFEINLINPKAENSNSENLSDAEQLGYESLS